MPVQTVVEYYRDTAQTRTLEEDEVAAYLSARLRQGLNKWKHDKISLRWWEYLPDQRTLAAEVRWSRGKMSRFLLDVWRPDLPYPPEQDLEHEEKRLKDHRRKENRQLKQQRDNSRDYYKDE